MIMNFTKTPPTKPGAYWIKREDAFGPAHVYEEQSGVLCVAFVSMPGRYRIAQDHELSQIEAEWCGPLVPAEEVQKAFYEGHVCAFSSDPDLDPVRLNYGNSRARRVAEGVEP
jgi:hypothetical protein